MKYARVFKHKTGYWAAEDCKTGRLISGLHDTELEAYKAASSDGYIVE